MLLDSARKCKQKMDTTGQLLYVDWNSHCNSQRPAGILGLLPHSHPHRHCKHWSSSIGSIIILYNITPLFTHYDPTSLIQIPREWSIFLTIRVCLEVLLFRSGFDSSNEWNLKYRPLLTQVQVYCQPPSV